jgi:hypothetical protein
LTKRSQHTTLAALGWAGVRERKEGIQGLALDDGVQKIKEDIQEIKRELAGC